MPQVRAEVCDRCKSEGGYHTTIRHNATCSMVPAWVLCDMPGCHNGIVDLDENARINLGLCGCGGCPTNLRVNNGTH